MGSHDYYIPIINQIMLEGFTVRFVYSTKKITYKPIPGTKWKQKIISYVTKTRYVEPYSWRRFRNGRLYLMAWDTQTNDRIRGFDLMVIRDVMKQTKRSEKRYRIKTTIP